METLKSLAIGALLVGSMAATAKVVLDMPVVEQTVLRECVRVVSPEPAHSCTNLPDRYTTREVM